MAAVMNTVMHTAWLVARQSGDGPEGANSTSENLEGTPGHCASNNEYNGSLGVRISAIFVILVGSLFGAWFPVFTRKRVTNPLFDKLFFGAKYFGSGVIIATAFIHLLAPANEALTNPCLTGPITQYSWPQGIALMTIFALFFAELMTVRYANFDDQTVQPAAAQELSKLSDVDLDPKLQANAQADGATHRLSTYGEDHLGHDREHASNGDPEAKYAERSMIPENYAAQMTAVFILEFGVIFHSIFIGLTLAVAGEEFNTLYIVLVFHQTFEGLGLGTRLASVPWAPAKRWTPYLLGLGYGVSTPIAIAIGLGVRTTFAPESATALIANGVFDSISAGILIYTGLVELMAHEFMFSPSMQKAPIKTVLAAFFVMCLGAALMALLGKWA